MKLLADTMSVVVQEREALHHCLSTLMSDPGAAAELGPSLLMPVRSARSQVEQAALQLASQGHPVATKVSACKLQMQPSGVKPRGLKWC